MDLSTYVRVGRYDLPEPTRTTTPVGSVLAQEASAVTYNWDTDTLFVVGDGGTSIVQISKTGELIDSMTLAQGSSPQGTEFYDTEGLSYIGNGQFVMTEERDRNAVKFAYVADTVLDREDAQTVNIGTNVGNVGLEGLSFDPQTGGFIFVKEKTPLGVFQTTIDFDANTASNGSAINENSVNLFDPASLNFVDLADVFALSNLPSLDGQPDEDHLLLLSHESGKIVEVDRSGNIISTLTFRTDPGNPLDIVSQQHEGLTMDHDGNLYVVSENGGGDFDHPQLWVYAPSLVPNVAPTAIALVNATTTISENTGTTMRIKVADIQLTDDELGTNDLSVSGADAAFFEIDSTGLYIRAGTVLDFETKTSYSVTLSVDDATLGEMPDADTEFTIDVTDVENESAIPSVYISEVAPWSSGNSPVGADWFEVTNSGSSALDITGWKMDDGSSSFVNAVDLSGIASIAPGESVIFVESSDPTGTIAAFIDTWFSGTAPNGLQIGTYSGGGVGLSTGGDGVNLFNAAGEVQASVTFGASPEGPYPTFDNAAGLNNATVTSPSIAGTNGAFVAGNNVEEVGSPGSVGRLFISEVAPWSSGDSPVGSDWFEVTNGTAFAIDLTGWKMDDSSGSPAAAVALAGVTGIAPGETVIFIESDTPGTTIAAFIDTWFGGTAPVGLQFGTYGGSGVGLSGNGDAVHLYDSGNALRASVTFGASPAGPFATFDNSAGLDGVTISALSVAGTNGSFVAANDAEETGSPGDASPALPNAAPSAILLANEIAALTENTNTTARIKVADVVVSDDGQGTNDLSLSGADAAFFEVDSTGLYMKAGTSLDFEAKASYAVTVAVDDASIGGTPDASTDFMLTVTDIVDEGAGSTVFITEVAPWSSGDSPVGEDWFEVTNAGSAPLDISGWRMDDESASFGDSALLNGITTIAPGESVIFIGGDASQEVIDAFIDTWFGGIAPAGLQIGTHDGAGLGAGGDGVYLFDAAGQVQASVTFGASPGGPFSTFDNTAGINDAPVSTLSVVSAHGAFVAANDAAEIGSPGAVGGLFISEAAPWSSGDSPVGADWFEVTNGAPFAIDLTGWKVDDSSASLANAVALTGISSIAPGESMIFIEGSDPAAAIASFIDTWFGGFAPEGLQFGTYSGSGIGLSGNGDALNLFDAAGTLQASISFGASPEGPFATFENIAGLSGVEIAALSGDGVNGAFIAANDGDATGSPGEIANVNHAPVAVDDVLVALADRPANYATDQLLANDGDPDFDLVTFEAVSDGTNGTVSIAGSVITYTPDAGFSGQDSFTYSVSDGNGGTDTATVTVSVVSPSAANQFRLFASDGFAGAIGGSGAVIGTGGFQDIAVLDVAGTVSFDPSFNQGDDIVRLSGDADDWYVSKSGSSAIFADGDTFVQLAVGPAGMAVVFDDGARTLRLDVGGGGAFLIGDQVFTATLARVDAAPDGTVLPGGADAQASARLFLAEDGGASAAGKVNVIGTGGAEIATLLSGTITLDPSFNKGGDVIRVDEAAEDFLASKSGSSALLVGSDTTLLVPVGLAGATLAFGDGSDTRELLLSIEPNGITIDEQFFGVDPMRLMAAV